MARILEPQNVISYEQNILTVKTMHFLPKSLVVICPSAYYYSGKILE